MDVTPLSTDASNIWPAGQNIERWAEPSVVLTTFDDIEEYHPALTQYILDMAADEAKARRWNGTTGGVGGAKIYHLERWGMPEADLIHARALELFRRVIGCGEAVADITWSTVYRRGDHCMPHSHVRALASLVYFLDLGEESDSDSADGRFNFADPRLKACCRAEEGHMTTPCAPLHKAGTMLMFPGQVVHFVTPYQGTRSRITLSWNINKTAIPGSPIPD